MTCYILMIVRGTFIFFCPFAGTSASQMDRIAYIQGTSPGFPSGAYNTSPISPGTKQHTQTNTTWWFKTNFLYKSHSLHFITLSLNSGSLSHEQDPRQFDILRERKRTGEREGKRAWSWERPRARTGSREGQGTRSRERAWERSGQRKRQVPRSW